MRQTLLLILLFMCSSILTTRATEQLLLSGWRFHKGALSGQVYSPNYDDATWQLVSIPHDWAITGPFAKENDLQITTINENGEQKATEHSGRTGALPWIGEGWYRTQITIPEGYSSGELVFDGAMAEPHVWVNGQDVGYWAYGYNTFSLDFTKAIPVSEGNLKAGKYSLAVHLRNLEQSARWYPGAGLYRPVRLLLHKGNYLSHWDTFARTTMISGINKEGTQAANVRMLVSSQTIKTEKAEGLRVRQSLISPEGVTVAMNERSCEPNLETNICLILKDIQLWSPEHPILYTLVTELFDKQQVWDKQETKVGIRQFEYSSEGFKLNGQPRKFKGVCLHHDLGPLGSAFYKDAFRRQVRLLKDIGCDAIRTSHNTPAPWQMDICDEMGMMVMAESFDAWEKPKCQQDYSRFFAVTDQESVNKTGEPWYIRDITQLVKVGRNHPSIVMWSIGNEVPDQTTSQGLKYTHAIQDLIHQLDETRPCTQGMNMVGYTMSNGIWQALDIPGINYSLREYQKALNCSPYGYFLGTETASTLSSRGVYKFPVEEDMMKTYDDMQVTGYDMTVCHWSNLPDDDWMYQEQMPGVIGEFVWTGFDYMGEPTPYDQYWPSRSAYFGIFDLAGLPKDRAFLYRSHWQPDKETLHILPHWTWPERKGKVTPVFCYTNYPEAELFVNGKSQGRKKHITLSLEEYERNWISARVPWGTTLIPDPKAPKNRLDCFRMRWNDVVYESGEIKVVAYDASGKVVAEKTVRTAGKPHHIELTADRSSMPVLHLDNNGQALDTPSLIFVTAKVLDKDGNICPDADNSLSFKVEGTSARFNSCCNGDASSLETYTNPQMKAFHGELVIVVESTAEPGKAKLYVSGKGLKTGTIDIDVEASK